MTVNEKEAFLPSVRIAFYANDHPNIRSRKEFIVVYDAAAHGFQHNHKRIHVHSLDANDYNSRYCPVCDDDDIAEMAAPKK